MLRLFDRIFSMRTENVKRHRKVISIGFYNLVLLLSPIPAIADVFYCNATDTILVVINEIKDRPIYTQHMEPYPETLKFQRNSDEIKLKWNGKEESYEIHKGVYPFIKAKDYFIASYDGQFGALGGFGMTGYFEFSDGAAVWHRGNNISTFECEQF